MNGIVTSSLSMGSAHVNFGRLDRQQGCSMIDLSRLLFTDKSNVTGIVDRLERLHLVTRTPDPHDRRVILITLTAEGQHLRDSLNEQHQARIRDLMSVVNRAHLHSLLEYLHAISRNTEVYLEQSNSVQSA
jgi:MarR family 2-MHQ and catechol resistance regulon transcriptional repressor